MQAMKISACSAPDQVRRPLRFRLPNAYFSVNQLQGLGHPQRGFLHESSALIQIMQLSFD